MSQSNSPSRSEPVVPAKRLRGAAINDFSLWLHAAAWRCQVSVGRFAAATCALVANVTMLVALFFPWVESVHVRSSLLDSDTLHERITGRLTGLDLATQRPATEFKPILDRLSEDADTRVLVLLLIFPGAGALLSALALVRIAKGKRPLLLGCGLTAIALACCILGSWFCVRATQGTIESARSVSRLYSGHASFGDAIEIASALALGKTLLRMCSVWPVVVLVAAGASVPMGVAVTLQRCLSARPVAQLAAMLSDGRKRVRARAAQALAELGPGARDAVPALCEVLRNDSVSVRRQAAETLLLLGSAAADSSLALCQATSADADAEVRMWAASALGRLGLDAQCCVATLVQALDDGDFSVRLAAKGALRKVMRNCGPGDIRVCKRDPDDIRVQARREALGQPWEEDTATAVPKYIAYELKREFNRDLAIDKIVPMAELGSDLGFDEIDAVELLMGLEEHYGGRFAVDAIQEDDLNNARTVGDLIRWIDRQLKSGNPPQEQ